MDDNKFKLLQALAQQQGNAAGPSEQDIAIEKLRRGMITPEQRAYQDAQMKASVMQPLHPAPENHLPPEESAMLDARAKAIRDAREQQQRRPAGDFNTMDALNSVHQQNPDEEQQKFQNIRNLVKR